MQCKKAEYMKDIVKRYLTKINKNVKNIYFLYNGNIVDEELKLEKIFPSYMMESKITILGMDIDDDEIENEEGKPNFKISKEIICPECLENCILSFNDYRISLFNCSNKHSYSNILIDEFTDFQRINEEKIICNKCKSSKLESYENKFYFCCNCKINLCPLCKTGHEKDHLMINYDFLNYICIDHGEKFIFFNKESDRNLCDLCMENIDYENGNYNDNYIYLNTIIKRKNKNINELKIKLDKLKEEKNIYSEKFKKVLNNMELYYEMAYKIINIFNGKTKNYKLLININNIYDYNEKIIKDIEKIINEVEIDKKLKIIEELYEKMTFTNEIILKYKVKEDKIRLFGDLFVKNNKDIFEMIINEKKYELNSFFTIKDTEIKNNILEIKLKQKKSVRNLSYMFSECISLIEISNLSNLKTDNVTEYQVCLIYVFL